MMTSFTYYYRKSALLPRLIFGLIYLSFILFWMRGAWTMMGLFSRIGNGSRPVFAQVEPLFLIIPLFMIAVGLYLTIPTLIKILSPAAVISGDDQVLTVRGVWFKTYQFAWSEISYLRYEQRTQFYHNQQSASSRSYLQELLIIKPHDGRTVSVIISQLDGSIDDIIADIKKCSPNLEIKGFDL